MPEGAFLRASSEPLAITPESAGWGFSGLRIVVPRAKKMYGVLVEGHDHQRSCRGLKTHDELDGQPVVEVGRNWCGRRQDRMFGRPAQ